LSGQFLQKSLFAAVVPVEAILGAIVTSHTAKCNDSAKMRANYQLWLNNTDSLSVFPVRTAAYELRHSLDLSPVFLQNASGNPITDTEITPYTDLE